MKALPRWGTGIVGSKVPDAILELVLNGTVVSRLEMFSRVVMAGLETFRLVGIGGVWTASKSRRQGMASALLQQAYTNVIQNERDGTILFSLEPLVPFYVGRGYQRQTGVATMQQPGGVVPVPPEVAVLTRIDSWVDPEDPIVIGGLPW